MINPNISYSGPLGDFIKSVRRYKKFDGYNYLVSDCGRIFSLKGVGKEVKASTDRDGYKLIGLRRDKKTRQFKVHRLVLHVFNGGGEGFECNHINGVKDDNRLENLEWCTRLQNMQHAVRIGLKASPRGPRKTVVNARPNLDSQKIEEIIRGYQNGESIYSLSLRYGIKGSVVTRLVSSARRVNPRNQNQFAHNLISPRKLYRKKDKAA